MNTRFPKTAPGTMFGRSTAQTRLVQWEGTSISRYFLTCKFQVLKFAIYKSCSALVRLVTHPLLSSDERSGFPTFGQVLNADVNLCTCTERHRPFVEVFLNGVSRGTSPCPNGGFASGFNISKWEPGNLTAVGKLYPRGTPLASHTIVTAGEPVAVVLSLDVPSASTGTGSRLLLDGHDTALVRATVVDAAGLTVADASDSVSFSITSGPGRISGVHNGDAKSHEPQAALTRKAYHGLVRAAVRVTHDAVSSPILAEVENIGASLREGDPESLHYGPYTGDMAIVVSASAAGLKGDTVSIPVTTDREESVLAVAQRGLAQPLYFD